MTFSAFENTMYTDIFIVRRDCVFRNFRIFPFVEKAVFSLFSSRKDAHVFVFVTQKRYRNVVFSDYGNVRKSHKISTFCIFSRILTMRKDRILCSDTEADDLGIGEKDVFDRLIVMDDVSGLADKSNEFCSFLTVFRKYRYSCSYIFHIVFPKLRNWQMILSQTKIFNIFPSAV